MTYAPTSPRGNVMRTLAAPSEAAAWRKLMDALVTRDRAGLEAAGWTVRPYPSQTQANR